MVFRDECFLPLKQQIFDAAMDLITRERNGEKVNTQLIRRITDCYVVLGLDADSEDPSHDDPLVQPSIKL